MMPRPRPISPPAFGRRQRFVLDGAALAAPAPSISSDIKLFAANFLAGFLFVAVYLA